ncbi:MAG: hypothetical protein A2V93_03930 [Ignavibacteria bacterium RBG_16_34_14]|nr:MAG: hypothetical protein A2V93_03930 [Ignavibacteria bacterium RBG_16_34_14]
MIKKAAIIELGSSHDECFYSQILFLKKAGYEVDLFCSSVLKERTIHLSVNTIFFDFGKSAYTDIINLTRIRKFVIKNEINKVILNSAHGILVRNFLLFPFPTEIEFIGVIHDAGKILKSSNQKLINKKVKKYFVLSDNVLDYIHSLEIEGKQFTSFYPIFQPDYFSAEINKPKNEFWICVPGRVEQKRRDYNTLLRSLTETKLSDNVKIILLGGIEDKIKPELKSTLEKFSLYNKFILFEKFIPNDVFYSYLQMSDLVLPLIHPTDIWFDKYSKTQISGSYNMAFTFNIPLLCEKSFSGYEDFKDTSFFYETKNLIEKINELSANREFFLSAKSKMYKHAKWNFNYQFKKYIDFIES